MAHHKSALKRIRTNEKARLRNRRNRGTLRTKVKQYRDTLATGDADAAQTALPGIHQQIDKAMAKGVISRRTASRKISRLARAANKLRQAGE